MSDYTNTPIGSGFNTNTAINTELKAIETAVNSKIDESSGTMTGQLDMNSNKILNLADGVSAKDSVNISQLQDITIGLIAGTVRYYVTLSAAVIDISSISIGDTIEVDERSAGNGGKSRWAAVDATTVTEDEFRIVTGNATVSLQWIDEATLDITVWGGKGDWNGTTGSDNQPVIEAASNYLGADGGQIDFPGFPGGRYKLASVLTINEGVVLNGLGTVGSVTQKGIKLVCDHAGDGVIFDGNNSSGSTEGAEEQIKNIWILKGPNRNGGDALSFISTDSSNTPGFIACENMHISGNPTSSGEGLWSEGLVLDGSQATIGLKNVRFVNCGVTGVSTANKYLNLKNVSEGTFEDFYVRDASASFPSAGAAGITLDSTQVGGDPAINNPSTGIKFSNSRILGDIIVGEVSDLYFSNCTAVNLTPSGVPGSGTTISWVGGSLVNKYVDAASYTVNVSAISQQSKSDLSNQFRITSNLSLDKAHSGIYLTNPNATGNLTHTLPNFLSTNIYDFTIVNNTAFTVQINKNASGSNSFFPQGANLNGNITNVIIPAGGIARFVSQGLSSPAINVTVIKGLVTLTGLGTMNERGDVVRISTLTGSLTNRPKEATVFALDGGVSDRTVGVNTGTYNVGDAVTWLNTGTTNSLVFGSATILFGDSATFHFNGTDFGV